MYVCVDKEEIDKYLNLDLKIVYKIQCKTTNVINSRFKVPFVSNLKFCVTYITQLCYRPYNTNLLVLCIAQNQKICVIGSITQLCYLQ